MNFENMQFKNVAKPLAIAGLMIMSGAFIVLIVQIALGYEDDFEGTYTGSMKQSYVFDKPVWSSNKTINNMQITVTRINEKDYWIESDFFKLKATQKHRGSNGMEIQKHQYGRLTHRLLEGTGGEEQTYDISYKGLLMIASQDGIDLSIKVKTSNTSQGVGFGIWEFQGKPKEEN